MNASNQTKLFLVILDGWGIAPPGPGNAITQAKLPHFDKLWQNYPHSQLAAAGKAVGLPEGADGNSEVGHLNLGAGRIVLQDVLRISQSIDKGTFFTNPAFARAIAHVRQHKSQLHLLGLVGNGLVHASNQHLLALIRLAAQAKVSRLFLHLFTDGRDSPPRSAMTSLKAVEEALRKDKVGQIASVSGRYYAMDRDWRWDRTEKAYLALTEGLGKTAATPEEAITQAYQRGETDEFILPTVIVKNQQPTALVKDHDAVIFYNFRIDRPRQLTQAFVLPNLQLAKRPEAVIDEPNGENTPTAASVRQPFARHLKVADLCFVTMTEYQKGLPVQVAFPERQIDMPLGQVVAEAGLKQLRAAETEKERFVTYYFNGFRDAPFKQEERLIVPSPAVATYDLEPEMSAYLLTDEVIRRWQATPYDLTVVNFANPDMVGHTGKLEPTIKACETVDECLGGLADFILSQNASLIVTADHGNAEELLNEETGEIDTKHSAFDVPLIVIRSQGNNQSFKLSDGILGDVAPTILTLLGLPIPEPMTGKSLVVNL